MTNWAPLFCTARFVTTAPLPSAKDGTSRASRASRQGRKRAAMGRPPRRLRRPSFEDIQRKQRVILGILNHPGEESVTNLSDRCIIHWQPFDFAEMTRSTGPGNRLGVYSDIKKPARPHLMRCGRAGLLLTNLPATRAVVQLVYRRLLYHYIIRKYNRSGARFYGARPSRRVSRTRSRAGLLIFIRRWRDAYAKTIAQIHARLPPCPLFLALQTTEEKKGAMHWEREKGTGTGTGTFIRNGKKGRARLLEEREKGTGTFIRIASALCPGEAWPWDAKWTPDQDAENEAWRGGRQGIAAPHSTVEPGERIPADPGEGRGCRVTRLLASVIDTLSMTTRAALSLVTNMAFGTPSVRAATSKDTKPAAGAATSRLAALIVDATRAAEADADSATTPPSPTRLRTRCLAE